MKLIILAIQDPPWLAIYNNSIAIRKWRQSPTTKSNSIRSGPIKVHFLASIMDITIAIIVRVTETYLQYRFMAIEKVQRHLHAHIMILHSFAAISKTIVALHIVMLLLITVKVPTAAILKV